MTENARVERDYYPSHEALVELVFLLTQPSGPKWPCERWERAVREAEELVRSEP